MFPYKDLEKCIGDDKNVYCSGNVLVIFLYWYIEFDVMMLKKRDDHYHSVYHIPPQIA